jgi:hypothetical protein
LLTADRRSTKKQQSGQLMACIEERVMVHRTDIAGRNTGQANPDDDGLCNDGLCRPALNGALLENNFSRGRQEMLPSLLDGSSAGPCHLSRTPDPMRL